MNVSSATMFPQQREFPKNTMFTRIKAFRGALFLLWSGKKYNRSPGSELLYDTMSISSLPATTHPLIPSLSEERG